MVLFAPRGPTALPGVLRLHDDLAIACIERDGCDLRFIREELPNEGFRGFLGGMEGWVRTTTFFLMALAILPTKPLPLEKRPGSVVTIMIVPASNSIS